MNISQKLKNLFILDLNNLQGRIGFEALTDNKIYVNTDDQHRCSAPDCKEYRRYNFSHHWQNKKMPYTRN